MFRLTLFLYSNFFICEISFIKVNNSFFYFIIELKFKYYIKKQNKYLFEY